MASQYDTAEWILAGYVLDPLFELGLIERKQRNEWPNVTENDAIRVTALWRKFIGFAWTRRVESRSYYVSTIDI